MVDSRGNPDGKPDGLTVMTRSRDLNIKVWKLEKLQTRVRLGLWLEYDSPAREKLTNILNIWSSLRNGINLNNKSPWTVYIDKQHSCYLQRKY